MILKLDDSATKPNPADRRSPETDSFARLAYQAVLKQIMDGELKPNQVVQEAKLAIDLGFSRTPVREAIGKLEGEGFVVRNGRTVTVQELTAADYFEILHMRRLIECEAAGLAAEPGRIDEAELRALRQEVESLDASAGVEEHWTLDGKIHNMIAQAAGSRLLAQTVADLRRRSLLFGLGRLPGRLRNGKTEHLALIDALLAGNAAEAREVMWGHLENMRAEVLRSLDRFS
jgi:DNA-binding GntR family transcriptional regulator